MNTTLKDKGRGECCPKCDRSKDRWTPRCANWFECKCHSQPTGEEVKLIQVGVKYQSAAGKSVSIEVPPIGEKEDCVKSSVSSRVCERGTKCCVVSHTPVSDWRVELSSFWKDHDGVWSKEPHYEEIRSFIADLLARVVVPKELYIKHLDERYTLGYQHGKEALSARIRQKLTKLLWTDDGQVQNYDKENAQAFYNHNAAIDAALEVVNEVKHDNP